MRLLTERFVLLRVVVVQCLPDGELKNPARILFDERLDMSPFCAGEPDASPAASLPSRPMVALSPELAGGRLFGGSPTTTNDYTSSPPHSAPTVVPTGVRALYRLTAVLEHLGASARFGHYLVYRRAIAATPAVSSNGTGVDSAAQERGWVCVNDEVAYPVAWDEVRHAQAYMLFFVRIRR